MSILDTAIIGQTIPFDQFPLGSTFDRLVIPVQNPPFWGAVASFVPDGFGGVRLDPPAFAFQTYERTPDGWKRVE